MNNILEEDFENLYTAPYIDWEKLKDASFFITGATGLVGSTLVNTLAYVRKKYDSGMKIYILVRDPDKARAVFGESCNENGIIPINGDVTEYPSLNEDIDYIIHGASVTASKYMVTNPVETLITALKGTENMLELAKEKAVKGMVYLSSMEMYGYTQPEQNPVTEDKLGYVDILKVRSCYPEGKRACECLCFAYMNEYKVPVKMARLAQTFGAGVSIADGRVFSSFAKSAVKHENIVLHTEGNSVGNYCYTADVVGALLCLLTKGADGEAYNIVNEKNTMKIREMAYLVADEISGGASEVVFDIPEDRLKYGFAPDTNMRLSGSKMRALGWYSKYELAEMYRRMIACWNE